MVTVTSIPTPTKVVISIEIECTKKRQKAGLTRRMPYGGTYQAYFFYSVRDNYIANLFSFSSYNYSREDEEIYKVKLVNLIL